MEGGGSRKEMCPLSETEHQVAGSGLEAFEDDPWSLRWDGLSHRSGQKWRGGEPGAPREPADHADLLLARTQPRCPQSYHCSDSQSLLAAS
ncbi:hypothetical protein OYC64_013031 [Pagothenia borchgrevinki]|uniref:Uncharacterized protein n=1 Tax=Pagothenia borchgrevinki TaxID=8213 RepID=A0ABD2FSG4_PAGBO